MNMKTTVLGVLVLGLALLGPAVESRADLVGTAFTYQGQLKEAGTPANGPYDFAFLLYNHSEFGEQVAGPVFAADVPVETGLFTAKIDFGDVFDGTPLWLEIRVRPGDSSGSYTLLLPRQELTGTPYALYALKAPPGDHGELGGLEDDDHPQYVRHDETDSIATAMIQDEAVTREKITSDTPAPGEVLEWDNVSKSIVWATDNVGSCPWQETDPGIYYDGAVGIGSSDTAEAFFYVESDFTGIEFDVSAGDWFVIRGSSFDDEVLEVRGQSVFRGSVDFYEYITVHEDLDMPNIPVSGGTSVVVNDEGSFYKLSSSLRYKSNVADLPSTGNAVLALRPVSFEWNSTGEPDIGLVAEEVAEVIPDLVLYDAEGRPDGVKYDRLGVYLLQVVKSQRGEIAALRERNERFESRLVALETLVAELGSPKDGGGR